MSFNHNDLKIVTQVTAILKKDYKHHHKHADLAKRFHISESKLRKIFKQVNKKTINDYATAVRIENAKNLLETTDEPVKAIASKVGYDAVSSLEKQFKNIMGKLPLEWRKNSWQSRMAG